MEQQPQQQQQLRNLRDFLLVYNQMTELCFQRWVPSLHHRALDAEEEAVWGLLELLPFPQLLTFLVFTVFSG
uniref:Mitochondrial import inner membrane translocase subunit n=1 Tax=Saimiri boliviensis boliviensis TaxID=39432 RepID=A0A2K6SEB0_SAIBB